MTNELTFLTDLFLDDECPPIIKKRLARRIKEVEQNLTGQPLMQRTRAIPIQIAQNDPVVASQSPSMQRLMVQNPDLIPKVAPPVTQAAAEALKARAAIIAGAGKSKPEPGRTGPRKF